MAKQRIHNGPQDLLTRQARLQGLRDHVAELLDELEVLLAMPEGERVADQARRDSIYRRLTDLAGD